MTKLNVFRSAAAVLVLAASFAGAQTQEIATGTTVLKLNSTMLQEFAAGGLTITAVSPSEFNGTYINLPVSGGAVDLATGKMELQHHGGLVLTAAGNVARLENFTIDTTGSVPMVSADVVLNGVFEGRTPIFGLVCTTPAQMSTLYTPILLLQNAELTLSDPAAAMINHTFHLRPNSATPPSGIPVFGKIWVHAISNPNPSTDGQ